MRRIFGVFLAVAVLSGCAGGTMDEAECSTADWRTLGFEDGAAGADMSAFSIRRKACADHGVVADLNGYRAGRSEGLGHFCRPSSGYNLGSLGVGYKGVCPADLETEFLAAYNDGYGLYKRQAALDAVTRNLVRKQARADQVERLMAEKTAALASTSLAPEELAALAVDLKQLAEERGRLAGDIERLKVEQAEADKAYRIYEARLASRASR